jgi:hypothetical protein
VGEFKCSPEQGKGQPLRGDEWQCGYIGGRVCAQLVSGKEGLDDYEECGV